MQAACIRQSLRPVSLTGIITGLIMLGINPPLWGQSSLFTGPYQLEVKRLDGQPYQLRKLKDERINVFFFLSPECPLCENYSLTIRLLQDSFPATQFRFIGIFSGAYYQPETISRYLARYKPEVLPLWDPAYKLRDFFGASITPEVFVLDRSGAVAYSGKIDNWIPALGKKRRVITRFYLKDALQALATGESIPLKHVDAIGCFIE